jgi:hypothetical protein
MTGAARNEDACGLVTAISGSRLLVGLAMPIDTKPVNTKQDTRKRDLYGFIFWFPSEILVVIARGARSSLFMLDHDFVCINNPNREIRRRCDNTVSELCVLESFDNETKVCSA